jgi:hypothetical protein
MQLVFVKMQYVMLTVGNGEEKEITISPSILAIFMAHFLGCPH